MNELHDFLVLHYIQGEEEPYRYDFTADFLRWALLPPGYYSDWHIAVRESATGELVGFIAGVPLRIRIRPKHVAILQTCAISFLCVHQKYRGQHLAPVLMSEISRRAQLRDVHQRFYTTGTTLPRVISMTQYHHRCLNFAQLNRIGYVAPPDGQTLEEAIASHRVPESTSIPGLREMRVDDVPAVTRLWADFSNRYSSAAVLSEQETRHYLLSPWRSREEGRSVFAYVVEAQDDSHDITDFISFYALRTVALETPNDPSQLRRVLDGANLYYYASTSTGSDKELKARLTALVSDMLVIAQREKLDGLNCLSVMDNCLFCAQYGHMKFETGAGLLKWYLENYRVHPLAGRDATADAPPGRGLGVLII
ncbi:acyl-CoA N-acyltransferase [Auricularia subglabra TFB-10046 SS5]|uniref:Glycylpeptide N-tetradecanoyltransferase n=1 Tax=Auricularia subglabra (strain TFB-10046 / SS5) TaxID=717982 RepID=J0CWS4_AURST|nr:acyl-CoA N-acyltransferase [Auricularia subglabra TFB-10046 SS5]